MEKFKKKKKKKKKRKFGQLYHSFDIISNHLKKKKGSFFKFIVFKIMLFEYFKGFISQKY
ncbi:hypothetical protein PFMC_03978 [Plasmodium falciparum CAMP/Malaysia]|uniref:Uncharacterized protein n=1 Tax=Plasmodium falciparum (isolate Camp / Malaysia) TaxID=5835 RepID=A0A024X5X5_PLAFC|nr:hypothetical protein PFMC_03978 [Plasmodium falciparum CAMP/Malaysia]